MTTASATIVSRHPETVATEIDGEAVLMSLVSGRTFGLDKRGSRIWALIEQPQSVAALVDNLVKQYETSPEQCQADLLKFVAIMVDANLATVAAPGGSGTAPAA